MFTNLAIKQGPHVDFPMSFPKALGPALEGLPFPRPGASPATAGLRHQCRGQRRGGGAEGELGAGARGYPLDGGFSMENPMSENGYGWFK